MSPLGELVAAVDSIFPRSLDEPLIGWRSWDISTGDLCSYNGEIWPHREHLEAHHGAEKAGRHGHEPTAPCEANGCGIYAAKSLAQLANAGYLKRGEAQHAYGSVKLWGRIVEHENGWRAQYAYPELVVVSNEIDAQLIARNYGAEVLVAPPQQHVATIDPAAIQTAPGQLGGGPVAPLVAGQTRIVMLQLGTPNGQMFTYQGRADARAIAEWFAGFAELYWLSGQDNYSYSWRFDVRAWTMP